MYQFCCPVCKHPLADQGASYRCKSGHNFDKAKSGYVNLLLSGDKNSKIPGDNKLMVNARTSFLEKGYYLPLSDALNQTVERCLAKTNCASPAILDAGCGEGYYLSQLCRNLQSYCQPDVIGIDISKFALNTAAKRDKQIAYAVGSIFRLPVADSSCDLLLNLFAPYCGEEFQRVLRANGYFLMVIPGEEHLWELKQHIYQTPYRNEHKAYDLDGFSLLEKIIIEDEITLLNAADIQNLFTMTPYYYKTSLEDAKRLASLNTLTTKIQFELLLYQK